jgi:hypothetical protein
MSLWEERAGRNEALFREVNEQAQAVAGGERSDDAFSIVCECSDEECTDRLAVSRSVYEGVRSSPRRFLVVPGHEGGFEHVVDRGASHVVVEKDGKAAQVAEQNDPRA